MNDKHAREAERRFQAMHALERRTAKQPGTGPGRPDPIHVIRTTAADRPALESYWLMRWSLAARLIRDADSSGTGDQVADLGPRALMLAQAAQRGDFHVGEMILVGVAQAGRWLRWCPPVPAEPVPGSSDETASRN